jgi:hypothetical protein
MLWIGDPLAGELQYWRKRHLDMPTNGDITTQINFHCISGGEFIWAVGGAILPKWCR